MLIWTKESLTYFAGLKPRTMNLLTSLATMYYYDLRGKLSIGHRTGKGQFSFQSQRKAMPKNAQTIAQLHSSHILIK